MTVSLPSPTPSPDEFETALRELQNISGLCRAAPIAWENFEHCMRHNSPAESWALGTKHGAILLSIWMLAAKHGAAISNHDLKKLHGAHDSALSDIITSLEQRGYVARQRTSAGRPQGSYFRIVPINNIKPRRAA